VWEQLREIIQSVQSGRFDLAWSGSEIRSPTITHGSRGSEFSFSLSLMTDDAYDALSAAQRNNVPVRLVSLNQPLNLVIVRLQRVGEAVQITGRIVASR